MIHYFPATYPDELLYSVLARYHRHVCSISPKWTMDDLFGSRHVRASVDLQGHLRALANRLPNDRNLSAERLAEEFTLYRYYVAFQPQRFRRSVRSALLDGSTDGLHLRLGIAPSNVRASERLRYCPICCTEMLARHGEIYWRIAHQLPGVLVCVDHGVPLVDSLVRPHSANRHEFIAATADVCPIDVSVPAWAWNPACLSLLQRIAKRSTALIESQSPATTRTRLQRCYLDALDDRGLLRGSRVDQVRLQQTFGSYYEPLQPALPDKLRWVPGMARKQRRAVHPLHHIVFDLFLETVPTQPSSQPFGAGPWPCLNRLAGHFNRRVVKEISVHYDRDRPIGRFTCTCGYIFSRGAGIKDKPRVLDYGPLFSKNLRKTVEDKLSLRATARALFVDTNTVNLYAQRLKLRVSWKPRLSRKKTRLNPGAKHRSRWLELQRERPSISRNQIRKRLPAAHAWLYRHDRAWLDRNSPKLIIRRPQSKRVDWDRIDRRLEFAVNRYAAIIKAIKPPRRITLPELERRISKQGWIEMRKTKLPRTFAATGRVVESVKSFQLRRIDWAIAKLEAADESVVAWKVRRLAGLPKRAEPEIEATLAKLSDRTNGEDTWLSSKRFATNQKI